VLLGRLYPPEELPELRLLPRSTLLPDEDERFALLLFTDVRACC
jgi:hypothetical protein